MRRFFHIFAVSLRPAICRGGGHIKNGIFWLFQGGPGQRSARFWADQTPGILNSSAGRCVLTSGWPKRQRTAVAFWRNNNPDLWLTAFTAASLAGFFTGHSGWSPGNETFVLIWGIILGKGAGLWLARLTAGQNQRIIRQSIVIFTVWLLMGMQGATGGIYRYYDQFRWTGMWDSPNTFGLLMGVGVVLALGVLLPIYVQTAGPQDGDDHFFLPEGKVNYRHMLLPALFAFATGCLGLGLFESYSRGAWCATFLGFCHWMWRNHQISKSKVQSDPGSPISHSFSISRSLAISLSIVVILASVCLLCFWQFRQTEWHPARRAFSAARTEDFSWRNRVAAWEGDWQMMAEHPWFGTGWNQPEPLYEHYYLSPKLTERAAIEMNDYLLLGATLGVPALFGFAVYLWLTLKPIRVADEVTRLKLKPDPSPLASAAADLNAALLSARCQAGAVVLLVGFWFDGGLFKLPTAATFWILLELGAV